MTGTVRWGGTALKGLAVLTFLILAASACGPAAEPPPAPPPPPPPPPLVGGPGKPDNGMQGIPGVDRTATRNYLLALGWGDNLPDSQVVETQLTWGSNSSGLVRIVPAVTANEVSWQSLLKGGPGHFVAKIYNLENKALGPFGLGPLETGYLWVGEIATNQRGIAIYTVKNNGVAVRVPVNLSLKGYCQEPHAVPAVKLQEPRCPPVGDTAQQTGASNGPRFILASTTSTATQAGRGLWVSCSGGCCEVDGIETM